MEFISDCTHEAIKKAARALKDGHLVAFPTETVYGLGADATNEKAVSRIYSVKGRPTDHPLIVHISSIKKIDDWAIDIPDFAYELATEFWPGPMTLILRKSLLARDFITAGQQSIALRVPRHSCAQKLLKEFELNGGMGVAAPSANKYGAVSPTSSIAVLKELGSALNFKDMILSSSGCNIGIESTIINCLGSKPQILRPGFLLEENILEKFSSMEFGTYNSNNLRFSGNKKNHYSPSAILAINEVPKEGQGLIALRSFETPKGVIRLSSPANMNEFARELYAAFRLADDMGIEQISIVLPEYRGLGIAIWDRVYRAASGK